MSASMELAAKSINLLYLDAKASAEPIRLALFISDIPFNDVRVSYAQIASMRESGHLPFGQVPALEVDGKVYVQSQAILRWVGRQTRLYPNHLQLQADQVDEALADIKHSLLPAWYGAVMGRNPTTGEPLLRLDEQQRAMTIELLNSVVLPTRLAQLDRLLTVTSDGPFVCGEEMTIADLSLYVFAAGLQDGTGVPPGISTTILRPFSRILKVLHKVENHEKVIAWNSRASPAPAETTHNS
mmetsp:Transcript_18553/g.42702  ORF Transcript_18553/g.42702 Transcript_18553/m.42702 type:complete len:241 (+) Transcript_18553:15-737(+)